ncbi:MAG: ATP-grasp domain-containing protein [Candidatus Thorarchaeota archaeon]
MEDTNHMAPNSSFLAGKKVGLIGFNARPIAASLSRAGAESYVSDYWGDSDLKEVSTDCIAVLSPIQGLRQRQPLGLPLHLSLIENFFLLTKKVELDYILIGSGFDDHTESLTPLHESGLLVGSEPTRMKKSRNLSLISELISNESLNIPRRQEFLSSAELIQKSAEIDFPFVIRPSYSGGGSGIKFINRQEDLEQITNRLSKTDEQPPLILHQYIRGRDLSCSVLSTGTEAKAVSVQGQLIGLPSAGRNCDFVYCGNYYPSGFDLATEQKIMEISENLSVQLGLKGSIGFDFVVDESNALWLMEINPRIQGTLEMIEFAGNISITEQHIRSVNNDLIDDIPNLCPSVKMIVYSRRDGRITNLSSFPNTFDKSFTGVIVNRGDPICTVINTGDTRQECYLKTHETACAIQRSIVSIKYQ